MSGHKLYLASNHAGAKEWLLRVHGLDASHYTETPELAPGDVWVGDHVIFAKTMPWTVLAKFSANASQVFVMVNRVRRGQRGKSLSYKDLKANHAWLMPLVVAPSADPLPGPGGDVILVTRHPGAQTWLTRRYPEAPLVDHWEEADFDRVHPGTTVIGVLPVEVAERVCRKKARMAVLEFATPLPTHREVTATDMEAHGPSLRPYSVRFWEPVVCADCGTDWLLPRAYGCHRCGGVSPFNAQAAQMPFGRR